MKKEPEGKLIISPLVGTFYAAPAEDAPSFVKVGDKVEVGQVVGIVEAMKLMNEIESELCRYSCRSSCRKWRTGRIRPAAF